MSKKSSSSSGIGFTGLLTIVFITLKLCNVIAWSWWWVISPVWISVCIAILLIVFVVAVEELEDKKKIHIEPGEIIGKKSKFMEKLDEAMKASEEKRKSQAK